MNFLCTHDDSLIALFDIRKICSLEHESGGQTVIAVLRGDGTLVELARDYGIDSLARSLDPVR